MKIVRLLIISVFVTFSSCKKENKLLFGDWITNTTYSTLYSKCSITSFGKFGRFTEYNSDDCSTKTGEIKKGKYSYDGQTLSVKVSSSNTSFTLVEDKGDMFVFESNNLPGLFITMTKN